MISSPTAPATPMYTHMLSAFASPSLPDSPEVEWPPPQGVFNPAPGVGVLKNSDLRLMKFDWDRVDAVDVMAPGSEVPDGRDSFDFAVVTEMTAPSVGK